MAVGVRLGRPVIVSGGDDGAVRCGTWSGGAGLGPLTGHDYTVYAVAVGERGAGPSSSRRP